MSDFFDHHTSHQVGTDAERLAKAAALTRLASEVLWEAGVVLRSVAPSDGSQWDAEGRRMNYDLCRLADGSRAVASQLDAALPHARASAPRGPQETP